MKDDLKYNWCAFAVMIINRCTIEQAFQQMEEGNVKRRYKKHWSNDELEAVVFYRDCGMTNNEVGEMFGVGASRISRIYNAEKKKASSEEQ